uniref:Uncharacterized protein n=1 Tax=Shewanella putrefaciens (strain 200) TaxID=399804 RepID=E6XJN3_SHEP2
MILEVQYLTGIVVVFFVKNLTKLRHALIQYTEYFMAVYKIMRFN